MDKYTRTTAGTWVLVQALAWGRHKGTPRAAGYLLPVLLVMAGASAALTAVTGGNGSSVNVLWGVVLAVILLPAGLAWGVYRHRRFQDRTWGADDEATSEAGLAAARTVLTPGQKQLYKTVVHEWVRQHRVSDPDNRFARLQERDVATSGT